MNRIYLFFLLSLYVAVVGLYAQEQVQCFSDNWRERSYVNPFETVLKSLSVSSDAAIEVDVDLSSMLAPVLSTQFGVNFPFRNGSDQRTRVALYKNIITTMRFPAGSGSNTYFFDGNIPETTQLYYDQTGAIQSVAGINGVNSNYLTPEIFAQFKTDIKGEPIIVVNYFYARYGTTAAGTRLARVQQAADYAAAFVRKMNIELKANVRYWEVGNECYGRWEAGYNIKDATIGVVTGKEYGEDFRTFVTAMKAVDPSIKIGAVVKEEDDAWNAGVLPEVKEVADFLSVHEYFTTVKDASRVNILGSVGKISTITKQIQQMVVKYTGKMADYYPIALTEFNARGPYNCTMVNGLFITQVIGEIIKNKIGLASLWVSEWNWNVADNESKGFLAKSDPDQDDYTARQSYVPYYYYATCFGDQMVNSSSSSTDVLTYASVFSSGEAGIVLVNTTSTSKTVRLSLFNNSGGVKVSKYHWYEFYAHTVEPSVAGYKKFFVNGVTSSTPGGGPPDLSAVKAYEAVPSHQSVFVMQPYSVYFIVGKTEESTLTRGPFVNLSSRQVISPVVGNELLITDTQNYLGAEVYGLNGQLLGKFIQPKLDLANLSAGFYIVKVFYARETISNSFIKN